MMIMSFFISCFYMKQFLNYINFKVCSVNYQCVRTLQLTPIVNLSRILRLFSAISVILNEIKSFGLKLWNTHDTFYPDTCIPTLNLKEVITFPCGST